MPFVALAIGGAALLGANASRGAANTQAAAANRATDIQREQFDIINQQQAPYRGYGYTALNQIGGLLGGQTQTYDAQGNPTGTQQGTGYLTRQFGPEDLKTNLAPNYEFMLKEGQRAARQRLNAGGSGGSDIDRGMTRFAEDYASNAYQQAFNNFSAQRKDIYNTLAGIAGIGQTGQTATNQAATTYGTNAANLATSAGAAQAAGQVGAANAYGSALNNLGGMSYLNSLTRTPAPIQTGPTQTAAAYTPIIG